ncbi:MAG: hypothetical protein M0Q01_16105 [Syntrophales bacterium]|jgi:hypothetical protein|nr:hypothetical protein [Syntrophales bacterium]
MPDGEYGEKKIQFTLNWSNLTSLNEAGLRSPSIKRIEETVAHSNHEKYNPKTWRLELGPAT